MQDLQKMAIRDFSPGRFLRDEPTGTKVYDYTHILNESTAPRVDTSGYRMEVEHLPGTPHMTARLYHGKSKVGHVHSVTTSFKGKPAIEPHSELRENHRGKGLGQAMYEALYTHALHNGVKYVAGGSHTDAAGAVHEKLADTHGLGYGYSDSDVDPGMRSSYAYRLKSEMDMDKSESSAEVVLITAYNGAGELLVGKRNDNDRYTLPGGHIEPGESPEVAALRELFEETGLHAYSLSFLKDYTTSQGVRLHCFSAFVTGRPHGNNDPDREVTKWEFVDVKEGLPPKVFNNLHGPDPSTGENLVTQVFGLHKAELHDFDPNDVRLAKKDTGKKCPHGLKIFTVNGEYVRDHADSDYVQGGNPERYSWIPQGEIWIDATTPEDELPYVALHECDEANLMHSHHEGYEQAHDEAKELENKQRHGNPAEMAKAEHDDEVERMLDHPNQAEKTLALKLDSVSPRHVQLASLDPDPVVHQLAIDHPKFGAEQGLHLMEVDRDKGNHYPLAQQQLFLARHDRVEPYHLAALYRNAQTQDPVTFHTLATMIATHPKSPDTLLRAMYLDPQVPQDVRKLVLAHPDAPDDALDHAVSNAVLVPSAQAYELACQAVKHVKMSPGTLSKLAMHAADRGGVGMGIAEQGLEHHAGTPDLYDYLFQQARLKPSSGAARLLGAMMRGPASTPERAAQLAAGMPLGSLATALQGKDVRPEHLDRAVAYANSNGDQAALDSLGKHPAFGGRHLEQLMTKTEPLAKAIAHEDFKGIVGALTDEGPKLVDHTPDLTAHPESHGPEVEAYQNHVIGHEKNLKPIRGGAASLKSGISRKKIFSARVPGQNEPTKFMVKPYHERVIRRAAAHQKFPVQGWAEMTTQALFHAGEIGHLHQKVHVAEHDMGPGHEKEPALVVALAHNHKEAAAPGGTMYDDETNPDLRKIAMMDFLANNHDRHGGNLLYDQEKGGPLAVDHSRNFQYVSPRTGVSPPTIGGDAFRPYVDHSAVSGFAPLLDMKAYKGKLYDAQLQAIKDWEPTFDWWEKVGDKVRQTFHNRLTQIKDPEVRAHMKRNFDERASWLDDRAKHGISNFGIDWYRDPVRMYKPGELTDDEQEDLERRKAR